MRQNQLFNWTRFKLAGWYSGVMGLILCAFGFIIYNVMAQAHWYGLDQELEVVSGTLHDALEPSLTQPGVISSTVQNLLPSLCIVNISCDPQAATQRHILGVMQKEGYYLRFLNPAKQAVATVGDRPDHLISQPQQNWQTLEDNAGNRY